METTTFDTALGRLGIGWTEKGLARVLLPGDDDAALLDRLNRGGGRPGEPTRTIAALMDRIEDYAEGERVDFTDVAAHFLRRTDLHHDVLPNSQLHHHALGQCRVRRSLRFVAAFGIAHLPEILKRDFFPDSVVPGGDGEMVISNGLDRAPNLFPAAELDLEFRAHSELLDTLLQPWRRCRL